MNQYEETFNTWNSVAALYQEQFMYLDIYNKSYDAFCAAIHTIGASILDLGCGPGNITRYLLQQRPDFAVHGVDMAPNMVELAKVNNPTASFEVMDVRQLATLTKKFDGIVCGFCLPYLSPDDANGLLKDCHALLNKEGMLYISFVEGEASRSGFKTSSTGHRAFFYYHQVEEMERQLGAMGFDGVMIDTIAYQAAETHTVVMARKANS